MFHSKPPKYNPKYVLQKKDTELLYKPRRRPHTQSGRPPSTSTSSSASASATLLSSSLPRGGSRPPLGLGQQLAEFALRGGDFAAYAARVEALVARRDERDPGLTRLGWGGDSEGEACLAFWSLRSLFLCAGRRCCAREGNAEVSFPQIRRHLYVIISRYAEYRSTKKNTASAIQLAHRGYPWLYPYRLWKPRPYHRYHCMYPRQ